MATQGAAVIDFGADAADRASVVVTGQTAIAGTSDAEAYLMAEASSENDADAHILAAALMRFIVGDIVAGVGFTIYAVCEARATGKFNVQWVWN